MALRKARKNYRCSNCKKLIIKGIKYWAVESSLPVGHGVLRHFVNHRICIDCHGRLEEDKEMMII